MEGTASGKRTTEGRRGSMKRKGREEGRGSGVAGKQLREGERADVGGAKTGSERETKGGIERWMGKMVGR
jgi:hypothetical protein